MTSDSSSDVWLRVIPARARAARRLVVFHHAGGGSASYARWAQDMPDDLDLALVELPGRGARFKEPFASDYVSVVAGVLETLCRLRIREPRREFFFGHSMGAVLALACIHELEKTNQSLPLLLLASGFQAPLVDRFRGCEPLSSLDDHALVERLAPYGGLPQDIVSSEALRQLFFPIVRADLAVLEGYPGASVPTTVPIAVLYGTNDASVTPESVQAWERLTLAFAGAKAFQGDHFFVFAQKRRVLDYVTSQLDAFSTEA